MKLLLNFICLISMNCLAQEPDIVKLNKGDLAPFDCAAVPFDTLRDYVEYKINYQIMRDEYLVKGPASQTMFTSIRKDALLFIVFASSGVLAGALVSGADQSVRNVVYGVSFVGLVGSLVILTF